MYRNVHIVGLGSYNPRRQVEKEYYIKHFEQFQLDNHLENLMQKIGRNTSSIAEENETAISMQLNACKIAFRYAGLNPDDIDMIISSSDTPEYLTPSSALIIREDLGARNTTGVFDVNCDCTGMLVAMDIATRYLKTDKKYKRILVTGSILMSPHARRDDMITYPCVADGASAVILEVREEPEEKGIIGSRMFTDSSYNDTIRFPACGLSKLSKEKTSDHDRKLEWKPFDFDFLSEQWYKLIVEMLKEHNFNPCDVTHYYMSQFSRHDVDLTMKKLGTTMEKATFIADKYGYTGCASPIMAMYEDHINQISFDEGINDVAVTIDNEFKAVEKLPLGNNTDLDIHDKFFQALKANHRFKKGDLVVFCSVAAGYSMNALLYKY